MEIPGNAQALSLSTKALSEKYSSNSLGRRVALVGVVAVNTRVARSALRTQAPPILALVGDPMIAYVIKFAGAIRM